MKRNRVCGHFRDYAEGSTQISITQISRLYKDRNKTGKAVQPSQSCRLEQKRVLLEISGTATSLPLAGRRVFVEGIHQRSHVTYNLSSKKLEISVNSRKNGWRCGKWPQEDIPVAAQAGPEKQPWQSRGIVPRGINS